jgi:ATP-dependent Clp protease, protease subunit
MEVPTMARPAKIRVHANRKITALSTEAALDRWNPGVKAATDGDASISIYEVIGEDPWTGGGVTVKRIDAALRSIGNRDVAVNINSPGGDVFEGIAIYNRLREHQGKVNVKVLGLAASAASIIAMAGDSIQIGASSFLMIHNAWVLAIGNRHDMREVADFLEPFDRALADVYVARSGQKLETVQAAMDAETWLNGTTAVELGYADALLAADEIANDEDVPAEEDSVKALRRAEVALCHNMPRSSARDLLNKIKGMPDAAPEPAMPDAGDPELVGSLAGLLATIRG